MHSVCQINCSEGCSLVLTDAFIGDPQSLFHHFGFVTQVNLLESCGQPQEAEFTCIHVCIDTYI